MDDSAQHERLAVLGRQVGAEIPCVEDRATEDGLARHDGGRFGVDFELHITGVVDVRRDFQDDADIFVGDGGVLRTDRRHLGVLRNGDLLADKKLSQFIVVDGDLRFAQDGGVRGFLQELDEEIHVHRGHHRSRTQRG